MAFKQLPDNKGMIYVPEPEANSQKKHPCSECFSCQWCSNERCALCRTKKCCKKKEKDKD